MGLSTDDVLSKPTEAQRLLAETEEVVRECRAVMAESIRFLRETGTLDPKNITDMTIWDGTEIAHKINESKRAHILPVEIEADRLLRKTEEEVERLKKALDRYAAILVSKGLKIIPITEATVAEMPPLVDEIEPSTSVVILADGHAFLAIDSVSEESGGYNIRFILGDGIELKRSGFSQRGIDEFLRGHVDVFNIKELVFQVVVTTDNRVKICRKFLWKSANDPKTISSCLNYALTYLV